MQIKSELYKKYLYLLNFLPFVFKIWLISLIVATRVYCEFACNMNFKDCEYLIATKKDFRVYFISVPEI